MVERLRITCARGMGDDVERKLKELDPVAELLVEGHPRMSGIVDALSILASLSTIAASAFVVWATSQEKAGKEIRVERADPPEHTAAPPNDD